MMLFSDVPVHYSTAMPKNAILMNQTHLQGHALAGRAGIPADGSSKAYCSSCDIDLFTNPGVRILTSSVGIYLDREESLLAYEVDCDCGQRAMLALRLDASQRLVHCSVQPWTVP